jgi:hypothetical protein
VIVNLNKHKVPPIIKKGNPVEFLITGASEEHLELHHIQLISK